MSCMRLQVSVKCDGAEVSLARFSGGSYKGFGQLHRCGLQMSPPPDGLRQSSVQSGLDRDRTLALDGRPTTLGAHWVRVPAGVRTAIQL